MFTVFLCFLPLHDRSTRTKHLWRTKHQNKIQSKELYFYKTLKIFYLKTTVTTYVLSFFLHIDYVGIDIKMNNVIFKCLQLTFLHQRYIFLMVMAVSISSSTFPHWAMRWELDGKKKCPAWVTGSLCRWRMEKYGFPLHIWQRDNFLCFPSERDFLEIAWKDTHCGKMNNGLPKYIHNLTLEPGNVNSCGKKWLCRYD